MNLRYEGVPPTYRKIASALGLAVESDDDVTASKKGIERIRELIANLSLPTRLSDVGVPRDTLEAYIDEVMQDKAMMVTPGNPGREEVSELVRGAY